MSTPTKKTKHKLRRKDPKTEDEIIKIDCKTYQIKDYMIFNSDSKGFLCDCMSFVMNIQDNGTTKDCKHILRIKKEYNIV
jgi:predicted nucleic acid-binding Zn finger protein